MKSGNISSSYNRDGGGRGKEGKRVSVQVQSRVDMA